jgi:hypothetical protein
MRFCLVACFSECAVAVLGSIRIFSSLAFSKTTREFNIVELRE